MPPWFSAFSGAALLALLLIGCAREPERPDAPPVAISPDAPDPLAAEAEPAPPVNPFAEPARRALRIELGLDDYESVVGTWTAGDAASTFTAYFDGDSLRLIQEHMTRSEFGEETNVYYFAAGALFYTVQDAVHVRLGDAGAAQRNTVRLRVAFTPTGALLAAEGTVNGEVEEVDRALIEGVRSHAEALHEQARMPTGRPAL